ncbi:PHD and RING finger domain-containing protein 1 [Sarotherodon galilaeus]
MAYMICQFFHMDFWLLIIISSSILTSLQVAVCVVCYGVSETVFGEWSVMGSTIILVHSYYNVWLRAQLGWQSFLLRRDAVNKIKSLPTASNTQLEQYNDICAICFQDMTSAVFTPCSHFFHAGCLMPSLSFTTKSQSPTNGGATQGTPAANQNPAGQEEGTLVDDRKEGASLGKPPLPPPPTGMSALLHIVKPPLSSSSCSSSPLATDSVLHQSPADHPSASSFATSYTSDTPDAPASLCHSVSTFHQPTSQVLT